jgi:saccharopepsin
VRRQALWEVELEKVRVGDEEVEMVDVGAAMSTGSSLMVVPVDVAEVVNAKYSDRSLRVFLHGAHVLFCFRIGAQKQWNGEYTVDCASISTLPDFTLYFGGKPYTLTGDDYILQVQGKCTSTFAGSNDLDGSLWILGAR